ncbi:MAG TPA: hypothetical protein VGF23_22325 [Gaiellaceae bacterium]
MTVVREQRRPRRRRSRRTAAARWLLGLIVIGAVFALGIALGAALHDNPRPGGTVTGERTLRPGQLSRP